MDLSILAPVGAVVALLFAFFLSRRVMKADEGTDLMKKIAGRCPERRQRLSEAPVYRRGYFLRGYVRYPADPGHRRVPDPLCAGCVPDRRLLLRLVRLYRHEDRDLCQRPHRQQRQQKPERGPENRFLRRRRNGLCGGRAWGLLDISIWYFFHEVPGTALST